MPIYRMKWKTKINCLEITHVLVKSPQRAYLTPSLNHEGVLFKGQLQTASGINQGTAIVNYLKVIKSTYYHKAELQGLNAHMWRAVKSYFTYLIPCYFRFRTPQVLQKMCGIPRSHLTARGARRL